MIDSLHAFLTKNKSVVIVIGLLSISASIYAFFQNQDVSGKIFAPQAMSESPGSLQIQGDVTVKVEEQNQRIVDESLQVFLDGYYKDRNLILGVIYITSNQETINFSNQIYTHLKSKGYQVTSPHKGIQGCEPIINGLCFLPMGIVVSEI